METTKRLLLIDTDDSRRRTRVQLLTKSGYTVEIRDDFTAAENLNHESTFDLVAISLFGNPDKTIEYSDHLSKRQPRLPVLLLTDFGVYVPPGTLSRRLEAGNPGALICEIAAMLAGSEHVRELPIPLR